MKRSLLIGFALTLLFLSNMAFAVRVVSIYNAKVPVLSQSAETRNTALPIALRQVLVKVSGNPNVLANPKIAPHLKDANALVQEFSYSSTTKLKSPYILEVQFDPAGIDKLLHEASAPVWGANRPLIIAWVEYEVPDHVAEIIDSSSNSDIQSTIKDHADQRGLPLILPMMDMTDLNQVWVNDIVNMDTPKLQKVSERYASDGILMARVFQLTTGFSVQAKLVLGTDHWEWNIKGPSRSAVVTSLLDNVANCIATRYASVVTTAVQGKVILKVIGVSQQNDFIQLMNYLGHLPQVASVQVNKISGEEVLLDVSLHGSLASFNKVISVGKKLTPVPSSGLEDKLSIYQWNH